VRACEEDLYYHIFYPNRADQPYRAYANISERGSNEMYTRKMGGEDNKRDIIPARSNILTIFLISSWLPPSIAELINMKSFHIARERLL